MNEQQQKRLQRIVGALLFASRTPLSSATIRKTIKQAAKDAPAEKLSEFDSIREKDVTEAIQALQARLTEEPSGLLIREVANGYRLENDPWCGPWIRQLLDKNKPNRLSKPALETLAIIAYRQPCTRAEVEQVRGVAVDSMVRNLMELQLIRIVGRSELPGRPMLYGTTQKFLEHFGLRDLESLPGGDELRRKELQRLEEEKNPEEDSAAENQGDLFEEEDAEKPIDESDAEDSMDAEPSEEEARDES